MKKLNLLKTLIDLFFYFSAIAGVGMVIFVAMVVAGQGEAIDLKIGGHEILVYDWQTKLLIVFGLASFLCFVYAIFLLRKIIGHFYRRQIFHAEVIRLLNRTGAAVIVSTILARVPIFVYDAAHRTSAGFELETGGFDSLVSTLCLGLFFMVLSEVFKIAKGMKEENELTV